MTLHIALNLLDVNFYNVIFSKFVTLANIASYYYAPTLPDCTLSAVDEVFWHLISLLAVDPSSKVNGVGRS
jgi:hypothetical protein